MVMCRENQKKPVCRLRTIQYMKKEKAENRGKRCSVPSDFAALTPVLRGTDLLSE